MRKRPTLAEDLAAALRPPPTPPMTNEDLAARERWAKLYRAAGSDVTAEDMGPRAPGGKAWSQQTWVDLVLAVKED